MATDYHSWTVRLAPGELEIDSPDWVAYTLPGAVSDAMGQDDVLMTTSRGDLLHHWLRQAMQAFGTSMLGFLDRVPDSPEELDPMDCDGFVVSALLPANIPAALREIEAMLSDATRLGPALDVPALPDAELAQWRERAYQDGPADDGDGDVVWFLQCLAWELECAQEEGTAVVHVRNIQF